MTKDFAYVNHDKGYMKQEPHTIGNGTKAILTVNHKTNYKTFDICLDFPVNTDSIIIKNMEKKGILFDNKIEDISKDPQRICFDKIKLSKNNEFDLDIQYKGSGKIKYNVTLIPSNYNKHYLLGRFSNDVIVLDPYLIGDLGTDVNLTIHYPFDNSITPSKGSLNQSYIYCGDSCKQFYDFRITQRNQSLSNSSMNGTMINMSFSPNGAEFNDTSSVIFPFNKGFNSTNFTIMIKAKPYYNFDHSGIFNNRLGGFLVGHLDIAVRNGLFKTTFNNGTNYCPEISINYADNVEYLYIVRQYGINQSFFINGKYNKSQSCINFTIKYGDGFYLGSIQASSYYNGTISQFAFYNRSLSDDEISIIQSQGNYTTNKDGESNTAIYFNGNDYIITQNSSLYPLKQRTVSYWIKAPLNSYFAPGIFGYGGSTQAYAQELQANIGQLTYFWSPISGSGTSIYPLDNSWHNIVNVYDESLISSYFDGVLMYQALGGLNTGTGFYPTIGTNPIFFNESLKGSIDEFIIFNRSLSDDEAVQLAAGYGQYIEFTFIDENTYKVINNCTLKIQSESYSSNFSTITGTIAVNLPANEIMAVRYNSTYDYSERFYYFNSSADTQIDRELYLINSSFSTEIKVTTLDQIQRLIEDAFIYLLKYNITTNSYFIVEACKSDSEGVCKFHVNLNSEYYRFAVYYPFDTLVLYTSPSYMYSTTLELQINTVTSILSTFDVVNGIYSNLEYDNSSNMFIVSYFDSTAAATDYKLEVYEVTPLSSNLLSSNSSTSNIDNMIVGVTPSNDTTYVAKFSAEVNDAYTIIGTESYRSNPISFGKFGLFLILLLTIVVPFIAVFSISVAVALTPLPLLLGSILNIIPSSLLGILIFLEIMALVVAVVINK